MELQRVYFKYCLLEIDTMNILGKQRNKIKPKIGKYINNCEFDIPDSEKEGERGSTQFNKNAASSNRLSNLMNSQNVSIFMGLLTIYTIFASDIDRAFFTAQASLYFSIVHSLAIGVFFAEIIILMMTKQKYIGRFYFWIDLMSTLTMFLELIWIQDLMSSSSDVSVAISFAKVTKASRLSKIGAKSFKIMKLVRLIRLMKFFQKNQEQKIAQNAVIQQNQKQIQHKETNGSNNDSLNYKKDINRQNIEDQWKLEAIIPKIEQVSLSSCSSERERRKQKEIKVMSSRKMQNNRGKREVVFSIFDEGTNKNKKFQQIKQQPGILGGIKNCVILPPLQRKNVDPQKQKRVQQRWKQMVENSNEKNRNKKKDIHNAEENTKVGQILKEQIQKNIVLMIVGLIIFIPIFAADTWFDQNLDIASLSIQIFRQISSQDSATQQVLIREMIQEGLQSNMPMVYLRFVINQTCCEYPTNFPEYPVIQDLSTLRTTEIQVNSNDFGQITLSKRQLVRLGAKLNIIRGVFITLLLVFSSILFMKNIQQYALEPLQKMTRTITKISTDPFEALKEIDDNQEEHEDYERSKQSEELQTNILSGIMVKMINLVVIGAGQIGSSLITNSIQNGTYDSSQVSTQQIVGVFMYVRIANLPRISEILQDSLIVYINSIAQIVHEKAVKYGGVPCQTDSQGFLIVWPFKNQDLYNQDNSIDNSFDANNKEKWLLRKSLEVRQIADLSIISFVQSSITLAKAKNLRRFEQYLIPDIEDFENVKINCGIHIGQTLLGAIGSNFKLESKCLGQDVLITKSLSMMCEKYGISNIISQELYNLLSPNTRDWTRKIDNIPHFQNGKILQIFTVDLYIKGIDQEDYPMVTFNNMRKYVQILMKERDKSLSFQQQCSLAEKINNSVDFKYSRKIFNIDFYDQWSDALQHYLQGDWQYAESSFKNCYEMYHKFYLDVPCMKFMKIIQQEDGYPPDGWRKVSPLPIKWIK